MCPSAGCNAGSTLIFTVPDTYLTNAAYLEDPYSDSDSIAVTSMYSNNGTTYLIDQSLINNFITPALAPVVDIIITNVASSSS